MKSIQTKIILLIIAGVLVSATIIGGVGIFTFGQEIQLDSVKIMNLTCDEKAQELNNVLERIEQSVETLSVYAVDHLDSIEKLSSDASYLEQYNNELDALGLTLANETQGAVAVYARFSPDVVSGNEGFFKVKNMGTGEFEDFELTDILAYDPEDEERVGWYYLPVKAGKPVWMAPYYNKNIDVYMISYVIPIYKDNSLLGIVGMDIDFRYISKQIDSIRIYETGGAFLIDENYNIVHSRHEEQGTLVKEFREGFERTKEDAVANKDILYQYTDRGIKKKVAFRNLENGMYLVVTAPVSEIRSIQKRLVVQVLVIECVVVIIFILIAWRITKNIVKPLKELNIAAKEIAQGNLDVSLTCQSGDEVGTLSESLKETANQLKIRIDYINNLAFMDKLTGVKNNTAYLNEVSVIRQDLEKSKSSFAVFVIDINGLKQINDSYGHEYGNRLIIAISSVLTEVFGTENLYRIGGDEFAVILKDADEQKCSGLELEFQNALIEPKDDILLSAAIGSARYGEDAEDSYETVFQRADGRMYKMKVQMKAQGESSAICEKLPEIISTVWKDEIEI